MMADIDLELQLRFLRQLDDALDEALARHGEEADAEVRDLRIMRDEVLKAQQIVSDRMTETSSSPLVAAG